jgi:hypothetical protein
LGFVDEEFAAAGVFVTAGGITGFKDFEAGVVPVVPREVVDVADIAEDCAGVAAVATGTGRGGGTKENEELSVLFDSSCCCDSNMRTSSSRSRRVAGCR